MGLGCCPPSFMSGRVPLRALVRTGQARDGVSGLRRLPPRHARRRHAARLDRRHRGWRNGFLGLAAVTLVVAGALLLSCATAHPGPPARRRIAIPARRSSSGLRRSGACPVCLPLLSMHFFAYATMLTILASGAALSLQRPWLTVLRAATCCWPWRGADARHPGLRPGWTASCTRARR